MCLRRWVRLTYRCFLKLTQRSTEGRRQSEAEICSREYLSNQIPGSQVSQQESPTALVLQRRRRSRLQKELDRRA